MNLHFPHKPLIIFDWHHNEAHYKDEFYLETIGAFGAEYELSFSIEVSATIKETPGHDYDSLMERETIINDPYITNISLLDENGDLVAIDKLEIERLIIENLCYE